MSIIWSKLGSGPPSLLHAEKDDLMESGRPPWEGSTDDDATVRSFCHGIKGSCLANESVGVALRLGGGFSLAPPEDMREPLERRPKEPGRCRVGGADPPPPLVLAIKADEERLPLPADCDVAIEEEDADESHEREGLFLIFCFSVVGGGGSGLKAETDGRQGEDDGLGSSLVPTSRCPSYMFAAKPKVGTSGDGDLEDGKCEEVGENW